MKPQFVSISICVAVFLAGGLPAPTAQAQVPFLINYQGRLVDGTNLVNGPVELVLRLYNGDLGGSPDYEDSNTVTVVDGLYATLIGDNTVSGSLADALDQKEVWIEVEVDGTKLSPRERLVSVGYSLVAGGVTNGAITKSMIGPGAVVNSHLDDDCVNGDKIDDKSILLTHINQNGAGDSQVLKFNGSGWWEPADDEGIKPGDAAGGDLAGTYPDPILAPNSVDGSTIQNGSIGFVDIGQNGADRGQVMGWDGAAWVPRDDRGATDHDDLTGLGDDDHPQYYRMDGVRMLAGNMNAGNNKIVNLGLGAAASDAVRYDQAVKAGDAAGGGLGGTYPNPTVDDGPGSGLDADTLDGFQGASYLRSDADDVYNDSGVNMDLRFEGNNDTHLLFLDGGLDAIGIGEATPQGKLQIAGDEVRIGDAGIPNWAGSDGDLYIENTLEIDGAVRAGGDVIIDGQVNVEDYSVVHDDFEIGDAAVGSDGDSEYLKIHALTEQWYLGVQNEATAADSDFFIGKGIQEDGIFHIQNNGDVGIGTDTPSGRLQVVGDEVRIGDGGTVDHATETGDLYVEDELEVDGMMRVDDDAAIGDGASGYDGDAEYLKMSAQSEEWYLGVQNESMAMFSGFFIGQSAQEDGIFHIANGGGVGIGTSNPWGKLQVTGNEVRIGDAGTLDYATSDGDLYVEDVLEVDGTVNASGGMVIGANGSQFLEIREVTGTTSGVNTFTTVPYPAGFTLNNTRILSASIKGEIGGYTRVAYAGDQAIQVWVLEKDSAGGEYIELVHSTTLQSKPYSIVLRRMP